MIDCFLLAVASKRRPGHTAWVLERQRFVIFLKLASRPERLGPVFDPLGSA
jgi:hypothetical protein